MYLVFPNNIEFHRQVASYFIKIDHDTGLKMLTGMENQIIGEFTYEQGTQNFLDEVPMGIKTTGTIRLG